MDERRDRYLPHPQGRRSALLYVGLFCAASMLPLILALRRRSPVGHAETVAHAAAGTAGQSTVSPPRLQAILSFAALPVWVNHDLASTAFCGKRVGSYWPTVFKTGKTPDGIHVLPDPINLMDMIKD